MAIYLIAVIALHGEATRPFDVVPGKVDTSVFLAFPILGDGVMLLQDRVEVLGVALVNVFDAKVVNNERESNRTPLVAPEAGVVLAWQ